MEDEKSWSPSWRMTQKLCYYSKKKKRYSKRAWWNFSTKIALICTLKISSVILWYQRKNQWNFAFQSFFKYNQNSSGIRRTSKPLANFPRISFGDRFVRWFAIFYTRVGNSSREWTQECKSRKFSRGKAAPREATARTMQSIVVVHADREASTRLRPSSQQNTEMMGNSALDGGSPHYLASPIA